MFSGFLHSLLYIGRNFRKCGETGKQKLALYLKMRINYEGLMGILQKIFGSGILRIDPETQIIREQIYMIREKGIRLSSNEQ